MEVSFVPMSDIGQNSMFFDVIETKRLSEVSDSYTYFKNNDVLIAKVTPCFENGKAGIARSLKNGIGFGSSEFYVLRPSDNVLSEWLFMFVASSVFRTRATPQMTGTGGLQRVPRSVIEHYKIPLPPIEVQREIVAEIENYQKIIDGARQVVDNWKPHIDVDPDWPLVKLEDVFRLTSGRFLPQKDQIIGNYNVYGGNGVTGKHNTFFIKEPTLIIGRVGENCGAVHITYPESWVTDNALLVSEYKITIDQHFLLQILKQLNLNKYAKRGGQPSISQTTIYELSVPLPPLETQRAIIADIEAERALVAANRELIARMEKKIQAVIARVWGTE
jgi:type I restriction enzyme M protein